MASGGISGVAVGIATGGALLVYAGFTGRSPLGALRQVSSGRPAPVQNVVPAAPPADMSSYTGAVPAGLVGGAHPEIAQAALAHRSEVYSQARRWQDGYSDCSSFVGKALRDVGITPPGSSVTLSYRGWRALTTIPRESVGAGDLLCGTGHIAIALSPTTAIGQQRAGVNVKVDSIDSIMFGQVGWVPRRYTGAAAGSGSGVIAA
jgi:cell wall-associated NlpC family hydrolase